MNKETKLANHYVDGRHLIDNIAGILEAGKTILACQQADIDSIMDDISELIASGEKLKKELKDGEE